MHERMPTNSESVFLSRTIKWIKENTDKKVLFTWSDGVLGKPGYVYQSANFMYGGFIWTDLYITANGEKIHPRTSQKIATQKDDKTVKYGHRPTREQLRKWKWNHCRGKQFRYVYFLCPKKERKTLLKSSTVSWKQQYPKHKDLKWKMQNLDTGKWESCSLLRYNAKANSNVNKTVMRNTITVGAYRKAKEFFTLP